MKSIEESDEDEVDYLTQVSHVPVGYDKYANGNYEVHFSLSTDGPIWLSMQPNIKFAQVAYDQAVRLFALDGINKGFDALGNWRYNQALKLIDGNGRDLGDSDDIHCRHKPSDEELAELAMKKLEVEIIGVANDNEPFWLCQECGKRSRYNYDIEHLSGCSADIAMRFISWYGEQLQ